MTAHIALSPAIPTPPSIIAAANTSLHYERRPSISTVTKLHTEYRMERRGSFSTAVAPSPTTATFRSSIATSSSTQANPYKHTGSLDDGDLGKKQLDITSTDIDAWIHDRDLPSKVLKQATHIMAKKFNIKHVTLQLERLNENDDLDERRSGTVAVQRVGKVKSGRPRQVSWIHA